MPLLFRYDSREKEFYKNPATVEDFNSDNLVESTDLIPLAKGSLTFQNWYFDGYRLANSFLTQEEPFTYSVKNNMDVVKIYFNRRGGTVVRYDQLGKDFTVSGGQQIMIYSPELHTSMTHTDDVSEIFSLQITKRCFFDLVAAGNSSMLKFAEHVSGNRPVLFSGNWLPTNFRIEQCINEIINCHFINDLKRVYLRAKAIELFVLFANAMSSHAADKPSHIKSNNDREKIFFARDYIVENYASSISLAGLARTCELNEFKLKNGFKELFGTSVIDYLIQQRLEEAKNLLLEKQLNVSEVAYKTGYSSPQYFARAFKKKFGINPTDLN